MTLLGLRIVRADGSALDRRHSFITTISPSLGVLMFGWSFLEGVGAALILPAIVALVAVNLHRRDGRGHMGWWPRPARSQWQSAL